MSSGQFPREAFNKSLLVTTKMKSNMKPFIEEYTKGNILWMYESLSVLLNNFLSAAIEPQIKINSMFAIKCMVDTCDYVLIALVQAYILPIIRRVASVDLTLKQQQRGLNMFVKNNQKNQNLNRVGYNYVRLSFELLNVLSVIKPWKLYYNVETKDPSQFKLAFQQISKQLKYKVEKFLFFKQDPKKLHQLYIKKTQQFDQNSQNYSKFFEQKFFQQIKVGFTNQILDIRQLIKQGDAYITDNCLQAAGNVLQSGKSYNIIRHAIHFISKIVESGNSSVSFFMHENKQIKKLVKAVINTPTDSKKLDRGQQFLPEKKGTIQERKLLYNQFLRSLELWGNTYVKNSLLKEGTSSNVEKYYKILKNTYKYQFPNNLLLQKQIKESEQNFKKNRYRNNEIQSYAKNQLQEQKEDSIIQNSKPPINNSKVASASDLNPSKKQITPQPKQNGDQQCRDLIQNINEDIANLQKNQRQLPYYMKTIQKNINLLLKKIQQVQLDDQQLQILMTQSINLEQKFQQKIMPVYQDYKKNKIDFDKFCQKINPKAPKPVSVSKVSKTEQGSKEIISENMLPTKSVLKEESNKSNPSQRSMTDKMAKSGEDLLSIAQNSKQNSKQVSNQASNQVSKQHSKQGSRIKIQQKRNTQKHLIQQKQSINAPFILPQEKSLQKGNLVGQNLVYRSEPHRNSLQAPQILINKQKILSGGRDLKKQETPIKFQASDINQSRYTATPQKIQPILNINPNMMKRNVQRNIYEHQYEQKNNNNIDFRPVTYTKVSETPKMRRQQILQNITQTPIKKNTHNQLDSILAIHNELKQHQIQHQNNVDDQMISGPSLNPLTFSYHDFLSKQNKNKPVKTFKQAINNSDYFIKSNKNSNMFKFQSDANSLMRPASNNLKKSQATTKINVTDLLQQRSKKYELEMRLLQKGKDMKIRQLQNKLNAVQKEKTILSHQIRIKQNQINTIRAYSQIDPAKSRADQYSLADDQNYIMRKLVAANHNTHQKKLGDSLKNHSALLATGELINTKKFQNYFENITDQKLKKVQIKKKQLLYKDQYIEIGYMGHLQDNIYNIACFITPQGDFSLLQLTINGSQKLKISHDIQENMFILSKKQVKKHFKVQIQDIPYKIPQIVMHYKLNEYQQSVKFILPCGFHKFFSIQPVQPSRFDYHFSENNLIRGEQIPYSRKILKSIDLLNDYLPHIQKLNKGQPNNLGQICFGGEASYKNTNLLIKISIKPNQFLYIQVQQPKKDGDLKVIQFYIATLNHFLMKDFSWA